MSERLTIVGDAGPPTLGDRHQQRRMGRVAARNEVSKPPTALEGAVRRAYGPRNGDAMLQAVRGDLERTMAMMAPAARGLLGIVFDDARPEHPPRLACRYDRKSLPWL